MSVFWFKVQHLRDISLRPVHGSWVFLPPGCVCNPAARPRWRRSAELAPLWWGWNKIRTTNKELVCTCESACCLLVYVYLRINKRLIKIPAHLGLDEIPQERCDIQKLKTRIAARRERFQFLICARWWWFNLRRSLRDRCRLGLFFIAAPLRYEFRCDPHALNLF